MLRDAPVLRVERSRLKANRLARRPPRAGRRWAKLGLVAGEAAVTVRASFAAMHFPDFLRIERDEPGSSRHYVVHTRKPNFTIELAPDTAAPDKVGKGVLKRVCIPNSWVGDYQKYLRLMNVAQRFFAASFRPPAPKALTRRLGT